MIDNFIIGEANTLSLKRVFHPTEDASREVKKRYFISDPEGLVAADHTIFQQPAPNYESYARNYNNRPEQQYSNPLIQQTVTPPWEMR